MKRFLLLPLLASAVFAAESAPASKSASPDFSTIAAIVRQQRDLANQALQDAQLQLALAQKEIEAKAVRIAELEKQIADSKPKPPAKAEAIKPTSTSK